LRGARQAQGPLHEQQFCDLQQCLETREETESSTPMTRSALYLSLITSLSIRNRHGKIIPFVLNSAQRVVWERYIAPRLDQNLKLWFIILKARREGVSTLLEALMLAHCVLRDGIHGLVMASKASNTKEIWQMAQTMWEHSWVKSLGEPINKELFFGRSKLGVQTAGTPDAARGLDVTILHGSEVASWPKPETWVATVQCLPDHDDTFCFLESTAKGKTGEGELFYNEWGRAERHESDFIPVFLPWFALDEYRMDGADLGGLDDEERALKKAFALDDAQLRWRRAIIRTKCEGDEEKFHQEYPATAEEAFIQSGRPFFSTAQLLPYHQSIRPGQNYSVEPHGRWHRDPHGPWQIYVEPVDGHRYGIGADSSMGLAESTRDEGHSLSTGVILDWDSLEVVGVYEAGSAPHVQAKDLVGMARIYNDALLCPEVEASGGGGGRELLVYIMEQDYYLIHGWKHMDRATNRHAFSHLGWCTNSRTRPQMFARIREVVLEQSLTIYSAALLKQLANVGYSDANRLEALKGLRHRARLAGAKSFHRAGRAGQRGPDGLEAVRRGRAGRTHNGAGVAQTTGGGRRAVLSGIMTWLVSLVLLVCVVAGAWLVGWVLAERRKAKTFRSRRSSWTVF
jgi:hypothetical protein